ncbi:MAG: hypothetical protein AAGD34_19140 [Pseudomonadota bacterium]
MPANLIVLATALIIAFAAIPQTAPAQDGLKPPTLKLFFQTAHIKRTNYWK